MAHGIRSNWRVNDYRNHVVKDRPLNNYHIRISSNKSDNSSSSSLHLQHRDNNNLVHISQLGRNELRLAEEARPKFQSQKEKNQALLAKL
ncbi:hypothetical protein BC941DRAFT_472242 [Chlamydoabsidia padenii]|nr:hypothetical protein BC941DRAFT_472242 [Chlamydoabsidia padenii]